jgi:hypothetical protein
LILNLNKSFLKNVYKNHTVVRILCNNIHISKKQADKGNTEMTKQLTYNQTIKAAIESAKLMRDSVVVKYWYATKSFDQCLLTTAIKVNSWDLSIIIASVDHNGNVTESDWINETLAKGVAQ